MDGRVLLFSSRQPRFSPPLPLDSHQRFKPRGAIRPKSLKEGGRSQFGRPWKTGFLRPATSWPRQVLAIGLLLLVGGGLLSSQVSNA